MVVAGYDPISLLLLDNWHESAFLRAGGVTDLLLAVKGEMRLCKNVGQYWGSTEEGKEKPSLANPMTCFILLCGGMV